jgi:hypothetical protein
MTPQPEALCDLLIPFIIVVGLLCVVLCQFAFNGKDF